MDFKYVINSKEGWKGREKRGTKRNHKTMQHLSAATKNKQMDKIQQLKNGQIRLLIQFYFV